jgi:hypothetical protein
MAQYTTDLECYEWVTLLGSYGSKWTSTSADGTEFSLRSWYVFILRNIIYCRNLIASYTATSTDVERAFLHGGLTVSKMRHSLSDESTRAASVLGAWCSLPGAIPRNEIMDAFKDKSKWPKNNNVPSESSNGVDIVIV